MLRSHITDRCTSSQANDLKRVMLQEAYSSHLISGLKALGYIGICRL